MADPRLNLKDHKTLYDSQPTFSIAQTDACGVVRSRNYIGSKNRRDTLAGALGKVGEFELLNKIGGGKVAEGLRTIASISDSIRVTGRGEPATTIGEGVNWVLDNVGLNSQALNFARGFNPQVANAALGQAEQIYNRVRQGRFEARDIPHVFSDLQNAEQLISSIFVPDNKQQPKATNFGELCGASPYAMDLIQYAPKYKFLFVVQFEFDPDFVEIGKKIKPAFIVKTSTRPNVNFDYEEVNVYNFRTQVAKRTTYQPMTMVFHDDDRNHALQFYTTYLKLMSPIANINLEDTKLDPLDVYEDIRDGMRFSDETNRIINGIDGKNYSASLGLVGSQIGDAATTRNILRRISIFHVYRQGRLMNIFHFYNPRITSLELDDLDMAEGGTGSQVSFQFNYDGLNILPGYRVLFDNPKYNLQEMTDMGTYAFGKQQGVGTTDGNPKDGEGIENAQFDDLAGGNPILNIEEIAAAANARIDPNELLRTIPNF